MKRLVLFATGEQATSLSPSGLSFHRVLDSYKICPGERQECWVVEYDDGEVAAPGSDPMMVGVSAEGATEGLEARVIWKDAAWRPATRAQILTLVRLSQTVRPPKPKEE